MVTVRMPHGWRGGMDKGADGAPVYRVVAPQVGAAGGIVLAHRVVPGNERTKSLEQFLSEGVTALSGTEEHTITESFGFTLDRNCGGRVVFHAPAAEGSVTVIRGGGGLYMVFAKYPLSVRGPLRAGIDTIVATASLGATPPTAPPENQEQPGNKNKPASDCEKKYRYHEDRMCHCYGFCGM